MCLIFNILPVLFFFLYCIFESLVFNISVYEYIINDCYVMFQEAFLSKSGFFN